ncbi:MAG: ferredoxin oxidoreductase [Nitrososphaeria archaeon]|nr:ferredoxin oxidoreductase [Nitrososphaeria archaeon]
MKTILLSGNTALSYAVKQLDVDVISAYPITPQTTMVEKLSEYVANGELNAEFIPVESEHSALSSVLAASAAGARVFTSTSSQGLLLMHEIMFITAGLRLPVVMGIADRAVSAPINIWNDHSDIMAQRDTGWISFFAESAQESYDRTIQAYRIAEDENVHLPVNLNFDGFILTHTYEPVTPIEDELVLKYAPKKRRKLVLDPNNPMTFGGLGSPEYYFEAKYQAIKALENSLKTIIGADKEYAKISGRGYGLYNAYMTEDSDTILVSLGSIGGSIREIVRRMRRNGSKVGSLSLKLFRPFPAKELAEVLSKTKSIVVLDKASSPGAIGGPLFLEIQATLKSFDLNVPVIDIIAGLGGREIGPDDIRLMFNRGLKVASEKKVDRLLDYVGVYL